MKKTKGREDNKVVYGTVSLPKSLIDMIKEKIKGTGMSSVSAYVAFVLRQVLSSDEFNEKGEDTVRKRLKKLGYL